MPTWGDGYTWDSKSGRRSPACSGCWVSSSSSPWYWAWPEEWLRFVFALFPYTRPWSQQLTGFAATLAQRVGIASVDAAPGLVMVVIIAGLAHLVTKIAGAVAYGAAAGRCRLP